MQPPCLVVNAKIFARKPEAGKREWLELCALSCFARILEIVVERELHEMVYVLRIAFLTCASKADCPFPTCP